MSWRNNIAQPVSAKATIRILDTDEALAEGLAELSRRDPVIARLVADGARPALRKRDPGFHGLALIVMAQQLSVASASAISARLLNQLGALTPATIEAARDEALKACGLSAPKISDFTGDRRGDNERRAVAGRA